MRWKSKAALFITLAGVLPGPAVASESAEASAHCELEDSKKHKRTRATNPFVLLVEGAQRIGVAVEVVPGPVLRKYKTKMEVFGQCRSDDQMFVDLMFSGTVTIPKGDRRTVVFPFVNVLPPGKSWTCQGAATLKGKGGGKNSKYVEYPSDGRNPTVTQSVAAIKEPCLPAGAACYTGYKIACCSWECFSDTTPPECG